MVRVKKSFWNTPIKDVLGDEWASILWKGLLAALGIFIIVYFGIKIVESVATTQNVTGMTAVLNTQFFGSTIFWILIFIPGIYFVWKISRTMRV